VEPEIGRFGDSLAPKQVDESGRHPWFAVRVRSRCEKIAAAMIRNKGLEEFLPLYSRRSWRSGRQRMAQLPLFPGYVFCRVDPRDRLPVLTIPGVLYFVGVGRVPVVIDSAEIGAIQSAVRSGLCVEPWPFLEVGRRVRLESGPLANVEGMLLEFRKQRRVVVSVSLLRRSVAVEIERDWVTPLDEIRSGRQRGALPQQLVAVSR
jgi:transcription antitermination factor NusG